MEISAILALLALVEPYIADAVNKNSISPEEQAALKARVESLRAKASGEFKGPEWQPSTAPKS